MCLRDPGELGAALRGTRAFRVEQLTDRRADACPPAARACARTDREPARAPCPAIREEQGRDS